MGRWKLILIICVLSITSAATLAVVDTGCFLEPQSEYYCTEVDLETANFECSLFDDCELENTYTEDERCVYFSECEEILCQSSCEYTLAGLCESGEVPIGEEELWCAGEGCCRYWTEDNVVGCDIKENKWACHIAASNAGAEALNWDQNLEQTSCEEACLAEEYLITTELVDPEIEYYSENIQSVIIEEEPEESATVSSASEQTTHSAITFLLAQFFLFLSVILLGIFFYEHRHTMIKEYHQIIKRKKKHKGQGEQTKQKIQEQNIVTAEFSQPTRPFLSKRHINHHKKQHAMFELEKVFGNYVPEEAVWKPKSLNMKKLQHLVRRHRRRIGRSKRSREKFDKVFRKNDR